ncbi:hypothetical protein RZS08_56020, partial [Arthrospira platensis SPKY1]|nr:hypothetical protein [Arthrospira platensis SPKY1]
LNEEVLLHDEDYFVPIGYSDEAEAGYGFKLQRLASSASTQLSVWTRRALGVQSAEAQEIISLLIDKLGNPKFEFLQKQRVNSHQGPRRVSYELWMLNPEVIIRQVSLECDDLRV